jgi:hypothetical protein
VNTEWTPEQIAEACENTAAILEGHWQRGYWYEEHPTGNLYCIEGALAAMLGLDLSAVATGSRDALYDCPVYDAICDTLQQKASEHTWQRDTGVCTCGDEVCPMACTHFGHGSLPGWNDEIAKDEQEVLDVLHATAKRVLGVEG